MQLYSSIKNNATLKLGEIPVLPYFEFYNEVIRLLQLKNNHCINYYCIKTYNHFRFLCFIGNDISQEIYILSHIQSDTSDLKLESLTAKVFAFHIFEREIYENFGIEFIGHPWLKPVRYLINRFDSSKIVDNYPFYKIESEELHLVGVGPVHAGIIEPGHFKFICNGEKVLHLEIQLGYQHRGTEELFLSKAHPLQQSILAESIAGDTVVGHSLGYAMLIESLSGITVSEELSIERVIALELERIAMHIADISALCTDVAYQFGQVVNEALRTLVINSTQLWCGNRFAKGLIRVGGSNYHLTSAIVVQILKTLTDTEKRFNTVTDQIFSLASVLDRFENIGLVTAKQVQMIGAVGMAARHAGLRRDIRWSHPFGYFNQLKYDPVVLHEGDVWARAMLRKQETQKSFILVKRLLQQIIDRNLNPAEKPQYQFNLQPVSLSVSLIEGWRGEICHSAVTDEEGKIVHYKIKDPSMHNWMALALAVREQEISDFPICNKSFSLSYCGHDL